MSNEYKIDSIDVDSLEVDVHPKYSICTLLTDVEQYRGALTSFRAAGFVEPDCEFLYIDNTVANKYDGYSGVNKFFQVARGDYIILCHQDLILHKDTRSKLDEIIDEMNDAYPDWALLGNAGGSVPGQQTYHLTEYTGKDEHHMKRGSFPTEVRSLDENFIVVNGSTNLSASNDLNGFHMYGTDLCMIARVLGYSAYVVDFHLWHLGGASIKTPVTDGAHVISSLDVNKASLISKYQRVFSGRYIQTTCTTFYVSGSKFKNYLYNRKKFFSIEKRLYRWNIKKIKNKR